MKKKLLTMLLVLTTLMVMTIPFASPALASQVNSTKDPDAFIFHVGDTIHYTMTLTNPGTNIFTNTYTDIHDHTPSGTDLYFVGGDSGIPSLVQAPGDSDTFLFDYEILEADLISLGGIAVGVRNLFHASGTDSNPAIPGGDLVNTETQTTVLVINPCIDVTKSVVPENAKPGDEVIYNVCVTNCGDTTLYDVTVTDDVLGDLSADFPDSLVAGEEACAEIPYTIPQDTQSPLENTVTAAGADVLGLVVTDTAQASVELVNACISITKEANVDYSKPGDEIIYTICLTNCGDIELENINVVDSLLGELGGPVSLAPDQTICEDFPYTVQADDPDLLINEATVTANPVGLSNTVTDAAEDTVEILHPDFTVTKECEPDPVEVGASIYWTITIDNTGDVPLDFVVNDAEAGVVDQMFTLAPADPPMVIEMDRIVEEGEESITNTTTVTATLPAEYGLDNVLEKTATAECDVAGGATRTPGFWQTHCDYTQHILAEHLGGSIDLGWKTLDSPADVFGMFWANVAKDSDGSKRNKLCQARVQASFHATAAILNYGLDNGAALPYTPAEIASILGGEDIEAIKALHSALADYNESGDDVAIVDNDGYPIQHADPSCAKELAEIEIADCN